MARRTRSRRPRRKAREPALAKALVAAIALLVFLALGAVVWLLLVYPTTPGPGRGRTLTLEVSADARLVDLAARLEDEGIVRSRWAFSVYGRLLGADEHLCQGEILLTDDMSPRSVLRRLAVGFGPATVRVTLPEGFDRFDVAARLSRWGVVQEQAFLASTTDRALLDELGIEGPTAEGYLFPDTYRLDTDLAPSEVLRALVANHRRRTEPVYEELADGLRELEGTLAWGRHEALVLASIVEKEAAVAEERPVIAGVFLNRLRFADFRPRRLQADPTVRYGCRTAPAAAPSCAAFDRAITRAMLQDRQNPYNTYRHEGLPPGPIANPGVASLRAVLSPATHRYLYFVAAGQGRHAFSATLEEHNAAVARYRRRGG
jgi:UPF0755 protein